jgi:DNA-directed RNA polymerase specialized sigma24 family protein
MPTLAGEAADRMSALLLPGGLSPTATTTATRTSSDQGSRKKALVRWVELTGASSNLSALFRRLTAELPALLQRCAAVKVKPVRQAQRRLTPAQVAQLVADYKAGASMKELAARWQLHRTTVAAQLRRARVELRRQGVPAGRLDEAVRLYGEGWSCQRLAERYDCDDETVRQALKRAGVSLRMPRER